MVEVRKPGWPEFRTWGDEFARKATQAYSYRNLWAMVAVAPPAAELSDLIEDFAGLPITITDALLRECGSPEGVGGLGLRYPVLSLADAEAEHARAAKIREELSSLPVDSEDRKARARRQVLEGELGAMWLVPSDQIAAVKKRSRRAFFVRTPAGVWAMRPPGEEAFADFAQGGSDFHAGVKDSSIREAERAVVMACALSPEPAAIKAAIEEYPAIPWRLSDELTERANGGKALVRVS
jgi:hypothetical protein